MVCSDQPQQIRGRRRSRPMYVRSWHVIFISVVYPVEIIFASIHLPFSSSAYCR